MVHQPIKLNTMDQNLVNPISNPELVNPISNKDLAVEINKQFSIELENEKNSEIDQIVQNGQITIEEHVVFLNRSEFNFVLNGILFTWFFKFLRPLL